MNPTSTDRPGPDLERARELTRRITSDVGGAFAVGLAYIGERLGLFAKLASIGPVTSHELAHAAGANERYVREWLKAMVAAEYIEYQPVGERYRMTAEQVAVFVDERSPVFAAGSFQFTLPSLLLTPRLLQHFVEGGGIGYDELGEEITASIDRMHRPWFDHLLAKQWLPGVDGLEQRLRDGLHVLDVGCGLGRSSLALAQAFPRSEIVGLDAHGPSIARAEERTIELGVHNARFIRRTLLEHDPAERYQLILAIDCVHDMPDPVAALKRIRDLLAPDGLFFWSEPTGSSNPLDNRNPIGRTRACLSPFHCLTVSLAQDGAGLGTIIGEDGARALAAEAGFEGFERLPIEHPMQQFFGLRR